MTTREQIKAARDAVNTLDGWLSDTKNMLNESEEIILFNLGSLIADFESAIRLMRTEGTTIRALLSGDIQALRVACPEGFAVVPRVATDAMLDAIIKNNGIGPLTGRDIYAAMVEAEHPAEKGNG